MSDDIEAPDTWDATNDGDTHLEQLQPEDTLVDRGVADVLDEGYIAPDKWSAAAGYGNTPAEMRQGETLAMRVKQEQPESTGPDETPWNPDGESREVGTVRSGRLVDARGGEPGVDTEGDAVGFSVGIDGGAASAEEAAVHVFSPEDSDDEEG
ncbi:MAG: DUF5709 domain-containing protein [Propioniciclava sp.]